MIARIILVLFFCANIAVAQTSLSPGGSDFVNGTIQSDLTLDNALAITYRDVPGIGVHDFLISGSVIKDRSLGDICFTFGRPGSRSADPTRSYCTGIRKESFIRGLPWITITNSGCSPSRINGSEGVNCEAIHLWGLNRNAVPPIFTRLSPPQGIKAVFTTRGLDSSLSPVPTITDIQYTAQNQAHYQSTRAAGHLRLFATNLQARRYALLIDGLPYTSNRFLNVVSANLPWITNPSNGSGFIDFRGFSLPEGKFSLQLVEYVKAPSFGAGPNVYSDSLRPIHGASQIFFVTRGAHLTQCFVENGGGQPANTCRVERGIGGIASEQFIMRDCTSSPASSDLYCWVNFTSSIVANTTIKPSFMGPAPTSTSPQSCFQGFEGGTIMCAASFGR